MGIVINLPHQALEQNRRKSKLEYHVRAIERILPFLRKHIQEQMEIPTSFHKSQVDASLARIREHLDYIQYYLKDEQRLLK